MTQISMINTDDHMNLRFTEQVVNEIQNNKSYLIIRISGICAPINSILNEKK